MDPRIANAETERLLLRVPEERDLPDLLAWHADPQTQAGLGLNGASPAWELWRSLAMMVGHWHLRGYGMWMMVEKATGRAVGRGGLFFPEGWPGLEVGWLVAPHARRQGFAQEMGAKALALGFEVLGADRLVSVIAPTNAASIAVAERLGERFVGPTKVRDTIDVSLYAITRDAWRATQTGERR